MRGRIKKSGRAIIPVPNGPALYGSLDRVLGHYRRYTREQLMATCERAGFKVEEVLEFNHIGSPAWWWNGRVLKRTTFGLWQLKVLDTILPLVRRINRFLPFAPLSWIVILRNDAQTDELESSDLKLRDIQLLQPIELEPDLRTRRERHQQANHPKAN